MYFFLSQRLPHLQRSGQVALLPVPGLRPGPVHGDLLQLARPQKRVPPEQNHVPRVRVRVRRGSHPKNLPCLPRPREGGTVTISKSGETNKGKHSFTLSQLIGLIHIRIHFPPPPPCVLSWVRTGKITLGLSPV